MTSAGRVAGITAAATVLILTAACSSSDDSGAGPATTGAGSALKTSIAATASSMVNSGLDAAQQKVQDAINSALSAAPITFDPGSSSLGAADQATVRLVAAALAGNDTAVEVYSYAGGTDLAATKSLAEARGNNVAAALTADGVDKARITVRSTANPSDPDVQVDQARIAVDTG